MTVTFRSASNTGNSANVSSRSPAVPTGAQSGDVVVAFMETWQGAVTVTAPSGFAQKGAVWSSGDGKAQCSTWWKRLTAADTGTYDFSLSAARWTTVQCMAFSGCVSAGDPFDAVATPVSGTSSSITSMSLTTTDPAGALVFGVYNDIPATHSPPTGFTETADVDSATQAYALAGGSSGLVTVSGASMSASGPFGAWVGALLSATPTPLEGSMRAVVRRAPGMAASTPTGPTMTGADRAGPTMRSR